MSELADYLGDELEKVRGDQEFVKIKEYPPYVVGSLVYVIPKNSLGEDLHIGITVSKIEDVDEEIPKLRTKLKEIGLNPDGSNAENWEWPK